jgi:hypothetical protein
MSTKAVHIEVISDLTTECFLQALRRFIYRREKLARLFSDNATTLIVAKRELKNYKSFLEENQPKII